MKIYDLSIELLEIDMEIKRTLEVPEEIKLDKLHRCLQIAMGWENCHMYMFEGEKDNWGVKTGPYSSDSFDHDSKWATLKQLVRNTGEKFVYLYDFGDCWNHGIEVSNLRDAVAGEMYPKLISATNQCPPEDSFGVSGYMRMLEILKKPKHPEYEDVLEWIGEDFDPHAVNLEKLQSKMERVTNLSPKNPAKNLKQKPKKKSRKSGRRRELAWVRPNKLQSART